MRELREELGLTVDLTHARVNFTNAFSTGTNDTFLLTMDLDPNELTLQQEEVQAAALATEEEILSMVADGTFMPYKPQWVSMLFACRDNIGTMTP